jgi:hypothetical protein
MSPDGLEMAPRMGGWVTRSGDAAAGVGMKIDDEAAANAGKMRAAHPHETGISLKEYRIPCQHWKSPLPSGARYSPL